MIINNLYTPPQLKIHLVEISRVLCQSNGAKYDPTKEVVNIQWEDEDD